MDWNKCMICQETTSENLKCPLNAPGIEDKTAPYRSFLNNINAFRSLELLPVKVNFGSDMNADELVERRKPCCMAQILLRQVQQFEVG